MGHKLDQTFQGALSGCLTALSLSSRAVSSGPCKYFVVGVNFAAEAVVIELKMSASCRDVLKNAKQVHACILS